MGCSLRQGSPCAPADLSWLDPSPEGGLCSAPPAPGSCPGRRLPHGQGGWAGTEPTERRGARGPDESGSGLTGASGTVSAVGLRVTRVAVWFQGLVSVSDVSRVWTDDGGGRWKQGGSPWDLSGQRHQDGDVWLLRPAVPAAAPLGRPCDRSRQQGPENAVLEGPSVQSAPLTVTAARPSGSALPGTLPHPLLRSLV